ncbi:MAG: methyltransferase domain-containing protein [Bacteroidetes bacterium]|nr:methyltransferase domain-containing protein [Bacteroidota bacterium]
MIGSKTKIKNLLRSCPICDNTDGEILHNQRFFLPENHILPSNYDVVCCNTCGFVFADTSANQKTYNIFYQEMSKYEDVKTASGGGDKTYDLSRLKETAEDIENLIPSKNSSILDIGCGNGGLLMELKKLGFTNLTGLDPSPVCVNNILNKGIEAKLGGIFNISTLNKKYDFIIFSHVFEHLVDIQSAVKNISELLSQDGLVYIETPDASLYYEFYVAPFHYFDIEHINHFCSVSLINIFSKFDYNCKKSEQKKIQVSETVEYPAVYCCFTKSDINSFSTYKINDNLKKNILKYILRSNNELIFPELIDYVNNKTPVIVFGAGSFTLSLIENTILGKCNIIAFIDNDSKKQGNIINGICVYGKEFLYKSDAVIIICSALFSFEIEQEIKSMCIKNRILKINT